MKNLLSLIALSFSFFASSQIVMKIQDSEMKYRKDSLQEIYFDRIFTDEISTCFQANQDVFLTEWAKFTRGIAKYLHTENFVWGKRYDAIIEIYFDKEEKVQLFFIQIRGKEFPEERYKLLLTHLQNYLKDHKFTLDAAIPFSNSGTITFFD